MTVSFKQRFGLLVLAGLLMGGTAAVASAPSAKSAIPADGFWSPKIKDLLEAEMKAIRENKDEKQRKVLATALLDLLLGNRAEVPLRNPAKPATGQERSLIIEALCHVVAVLGSDLARDMALTQAINAAKNNPILSTHRKLCSIYYKAAAGALKDADIKKAFPDAKITAASLASLRTKTDAIKAQLGKSETENKPKKLKINQDLFAPKPPSESAVSSSASSDDAPVIDLNPSSESAESNDSSVPPPPPPPGPPSASTPDDNSQWKIERKAREEAKRKAKAEGKGEGSATSEPAKAEGKEEDSATSEPADSSSTGPKKTGAQMAGVKPQMGGVDISAIASKRSNLKSISLPSVTINSSSPPGSSSSSAASDDSWETPTLPIPNLKKPSPRPVSPAVRVELTLTPVSSASVNPKDKVAPDTWAKWQVAWDKGGKPGSFRDALIAYLKGEKKLGVTTFFTASDLKSEFDAFKYDLAQDAIVKK